MIQRIQSVYWLVITALLVVTMLSPMGFFTEAGGAFDSVLKPLGLTMANGEWESTWGLFAILLLNAVVAFATIFLYRNRTWAGAASWTREGPCPRWWGRR